MDEIAIHSTALTGSEIQDYIAATQP